MESKLDRVGPNRIELTEHRIIINLLYTTQDSIETSLLIDHISNLFSAVSKVMIFASAYIATFRY